MKLFVIFILALVGLVVGCEPRYADGSFGSYANPDQESSTEVVTQRNQTGQLLFVIAWTAKHGGGATTLSQRNLLTQIHGHSVHPALDRRAVYAFQSDGGIQEIPLTEEQIAALFREMKVTGFHSSHSELWQNAVAPKLITVEARNGS